MKAARPLLSVCSLGAAPLLSGCVAAAIPVLAAGGVFQSQQHDSPASPAAAPTQPEVSVLTGASEMRPTATQLADSAVRAPGEDVFPGAVVSDGTAYQALHDFAVAQARVPAVGSARHSAILARSLDLRPVTKECSIHPAAVLIDLDPPGATLDPSTAIHADTKLAAALAGVRAEEVVVGWISANSADRAGDVRRALVGSGLDPDGDDELVLLRYPEERKQTRREDFAKEFCLVAIAGDNRGDFDELFQYIKNPFLAAPLDALLGNGWFLIPQPLT